MMNNNSANTDRLATTTCHLTDPQPCSSWPHPGIRKILLLAVGLSWLLAGVWTSPATADEKSPPSPATSSAAAGNAKGIVFHDQDGDRKRDDGEPGLSGIRVSNGRDIVVTSADGSYQLPITDDTILFVIKPRGWRTPISDKQLPEFYYIHKPHGSPASKFAGVAPTGPLPESVDFPLYPQDEPDQFKAILFGDPQPRDQKEVDFIAHDVIDSLIGSDAAFGVTLGDIVFDNLALFESQARAVALIGIPWYNVIGNHDMNYDAPHDRLSDETFERHFGPAYYSFDHGPVHFLVLDDVRWFIADGKTEGEYEGGLGPEQMAFIRRDLEMIPPDQLVVLMMHIPLVDVQDRHELYRLIEQRPFCLSISAHRHIHQHIFIDDKDGWRGPQPHHHLVNVTVCGGWWSGQKDERGIPHTLMPDGAPNGHSVIRFDGHQYALDFLPAGRPADYQMNIYLPEAIEVGKVAGTELKVNVFNGSSKSQVMARVVGAGADWKPLEYAPGDDPAFAAIATQESSIRTAVADKPAVLESLGVALPKIGVSAHLWQGQVGQELPAGNYLLEVRTIDMHGQQLDSRRTFRVIPAH
ncbi:MAG: calcineurin-like phosphoesterase family protein [Pirellulales bacterium]